ncbi:MAG TPA: hypothetical protein DD656_03975 [Alphaproteobacteria bacterium]|nr:hypothetical protein [Alphaproteobacteria bacterium]
MTQKYWKLPSPQSMADVRLILLSLVLEDSKHHLWKSYRKQEELNVLFINKEFKVKSNKLKIKG